MTAAGRIGVGEFVDQHDLRAAGDDGVEVHLLEPLALVFEAPAGNDLEAPEQGLRFLAAMGFDHADDDIVAVFFSGAGLLQHFVGLADARRGADENLELADAALFPPGRFKQGLRRGSLFRVAPLICHQQSSLTRAGRRRSAYRAAARSSAILSASTFTRGSPSKPRKRALDVLSTSWRTRSSGMLRAFATRGT